MVTHRVVWHHNDKHPLDVQCTRYITMYLTSLMKNKYQWFLPQIEGILLSLSQQPSKKTWVHIHSGKTITCSTLKLTYFPFGFQHLKYVKTSKNTLLIIVPLHTQPFILGSILTYQFSLCFNYEIAIYVVILLQKIQVCEIDEISSSIHSDIYLELIFITTFLLFFVHHHISFLQIYSHVI